IAIGTTAVAGGQNADLSLFGTSAIAIGDRSKATGDSAIAVGEQTLANGLRAIAIGSGDASGHMAANADYAIALGYNNIVDGLNGIGIGAFIDTVGESAVAIGYKADA